MIKICLYCNKRIPDCLQYCSYCGRFQGFRHEEISIRLPDSFLKVTTDNETYNIKCENYHFGSK